MKLISLTAPKARARASTDRLKPSNALDALEESTMILDSRLMIPPSAAVPLEASPCTTKRMPPTVMPPAPPPPDGTNAPALIRNLQTGSGPHTLRQSFPSVVLVV